MSGRESASRTLPRMRIGCGRLVAVLWTLLRKTLPFLGSTTKIGFFCDKPPQPLCRSGTAKDGAAGCSLGAGGGCDERTYTLCGQNVCVLLAIRNTSRGGGVYVRLTQPRMLVLLEKDETAQRGRHSRRERTALPVGEGYSKPPAGATRTAAGGFALAGVIQERERQGATYASEDPGHSGAHPYPRWRHRRSRSSSASRVYSTRS